DDVQFHDGTRLNAQIVADVLKQTLPKSMGPVYDDIAAISIDGPYTIKITLKEPSTFALEAVLETQITKAGSGRPVGTGPFEETERDGRPEMVANTKYYLGRPTIDRVSVQTYADARSIWAELLRENVDMAYAVGVDALGSLQGSDKIRVFSFVRRYQ